MSIIRVEKNGDYTILANAPLNDERLSWEARGLLAYLLSKPNNWKVNSRALVGKAPAGRAKVQRILRELEEHGYLERRKVRGEHGRFEWESVVREIPIQSEASSGKSEKASQEPATSDTEAALTMAQKPSHGEGGGKSTMAQFSADGETADGETADGKPSQLTNTVLTKTDLTKTNQPNRRRITTAAAINARVRAPAPQGAAAAVAAVAAAGSTSPPQSQPPPKPKVPQTRKRAPNALPDDVREALRALGWVGGLAEVQNAWKRDPERVRAWIAYVRRKGGGGGLLRKLLREEPGYPPDEPPSPDPYAGWEAFAAGAGSDDGRPATTASPEGGGDGASVSVATATPLAGAGKPPDGNGGSPNIQGDAAGTQPPHPDIGALPPPTPNMRRWWALAVGQIRAEMSKADFDAWLRPARLIAGREEGGRLVLIVATANDYARRWLDERAGRILSRRVSGFAGMPVEVQFVVV